MPGTSFVNLKGRKVMVNMVGRAPACCTVFLGLLVFLAGCAGEDSQAVLDLVPLQAQISAEYGASNVIVELQDWDALGVTLVHSSADNLARQKGAEKAREIAEFVCQRYGSMHRMDQVQVAFQNQQAGFMANTTSSATFSFEKGELECGGRWHAPEPN